MLEKLALLKIALCRAPVVSRGSPTLGKLAEGVRRSRPDFLLVVMTVSWTSGRRRAWTRGRRIGRIARAIRPDAERLKRVLGDEPAVLANDHDGGDGRSFGAVAVHRRLHFNPRVLAHRPLAVAAARATSRAARFQSGDYFVLVVRGNSLVMVHGNPRYVGDEAGKRATVGAVGAGTGGSASGSRCLAGSEKFLPAAKTSGRYDSTHQPTACLDIARNSRGGKRLGWWGSCSASRTISRTWTTISASDNPRFCSAATFARTDRRSVFTNADNASSCGATKWSGSPAVAMGESFIRSALAEGRRRQKRRDAAPRSRQIESAGWWESPAHDHSEAVS